MNDDNTTDNPFIPADHDANNARAWIGAANTMYGMDGALDAPGQAPAQIASAIALADIADQLRRIADRLETAEGRP